MEKYKLGWGENHPGHLVYLVDLSGSMAERNKIDTVIEVMEDVSDYLIAQCEKNKEIINKFSITIMGYNSDIVPLFDGSVIELENLLSEKWGDKLPLFDKEKEAKPQWQTYTANAFRAAADDIKKWIKGQEAKNVAIPVPIVIHITDGFPEEHERTPEESRNDALAAANELKSISVPDGETLLFNIHIDNNTASQLMFPDYAPSDPKRKFLYEASSQMVSEDFVRRAQAFKFMATTNSRFMVSNVEDKSTLAKLIAFGSTVSEPIGRIVEMPKFK